MDRDLQEENLICDDFDMIKSPSSHVHYVFTIRFGQLVIEMQS